MQKRSIAPIVALLSLSVRAIDADGQQTPVSATAHAIGVWAGFLTVGPTSIRLQMTIRRDSAGGLAGTMKSIDQAGIEAPAAVEAGATPYRSRSRIKASSIRA